MRIVNTDNQEWIDKTDARGVGGLEKSLFDGTPGSRSNFSIFVHWYRPPLKTPRHRHNFDQIRFPIELSDNYAPRKDVPVGALAYFPEGTYYGPLDYKRSNISLNMQFGGGSGYGYLDRTAVKEAAATMTREGLGRFEDGIFYGTKEDNGGRPRDSFDAILEYANKHPIEYPKARYQEPVVLHLDSFKWIETPTKGVARKQLGTFNERGTGFAMLGMENGASFEFSSPDRERIFWVLDGEVEVDGESVRKHGGVYLERGDTVKLRSGKVEVLVIEKCRPSTA